MKLTARFRLLPALCALCLPTLTGCGGQFQNAVKVQPDLGEALRLAQLGDTTQARSWADQAVAVDPNALSTYVPTASPDSANPSLLTIAEVFQGTGDDATLISYMHQAAQKHPDAYQPLQVLDDAQGRQGDTVGQRATATTLAALLEKKIVKPGAANADQLTLALAQAYCDAGNLTKGAADYQSVIKKHQSNTQSIEETQACNGLAYAWAVANSAPNLPQARAFAQQALTLAEKQGQPDEGVGAIQDTLGWVQFRQGDYKNALDNIQAAVSVDPRRAEERYHLGMVYAALHQPDAARAEFGHAVLLVKGYADAERELARLQPPAPQPGPPAASAVKTWTADRT